MNATKELLKSTSLSHLAAKCRVERRGTHEYGVFTTERIQKDELVGLWSGAVFTEEEYRNLPDILKGFARQIEEGLYTGPRDLDSADGADHINHSCEPNCGIRGQSGIVAMRDIEKGEEITVDYAMYQTGEQEFDCRCGTPDCRRVIRGDDYLGLDLRDRYRGYFNAYVQRRQAELPDESFLRKFEATGAWGLLTSLDLHDCDPALIRSADAIRRFTYELADRIKATRFGEPMIVHFGADDRVAGYSLVQLIETSLISAHFANATNRVYLDVFSCAYYEPKEVATFAQEFFRSKAVTIHTNFRY